MKDIIARLRKQAETHRQDNVNSTADLLDEAADEIERLREIEWMYKDLQK